MPGIVLLVLGILVSMVGGALLTAGLVASAANQLRDEEGFFSTPTETFSTGLYAITSPDVGELTVDSGVRDVPFDVATVRLRAESARGAVFLGIAPVAALREYLADVPRTEIRDLGYSPFQVEYRDVTGSRAPDPPTGQDFWTASASGTGLQELEWTVTPGEWGVVVMNADAGQGVTADLSVGVRSDLFAPIATTLVATGAVLLVIGIPMLVVGAVLLGRTTSHAQGPTPLPPVPAAMRRR